MAKNKDDLNPAREMAKKRWANTTKEERVAHAKKMVEARRNKVDNT